MAAPRTFLAFLFFTLVLALDAACGSSGAGGNGNGGNGAGGDDNAPCGSDADLCSAQGKSCGSLSVVDTCGKPRTVQCGDCAAPLSCGGGGEANVCGASCVQGCPGGFSCNNSGVCAGGSTHGLGIDVKAVSLGGKVTLNGGALGAGAHCAGGASPTDPKLRLTFDDPTSGASFTADILCNSTDDSFALELEPGTYAVSAYSVYADASSVPSGSFPLAASLAVTATNAPVAFDVKTATLSGKATYNGGPLGTGAHCSASPTDPKLRLTFDDPTSGASFSADVLCSATDDSYSLQLAPGTYRVGAYSVYADASNVPSGTFVVSPALTIGATNPPAAFDVQSLALSGKVTLDGGPLGTGAHCTGAPTDPKVRVTFADATGGASFSADVPCSSTDDTFSLQLQAGTYAVGAYTVYTDAASVPSGAFVVNPALVVSAGGPAAALDIHTASVSGKVTLQGGPLGTGAHCTGAPTDPKARLVFTETTTHASFSVDVPCSATDDSFSGRIQPGTYAVSVYSVYSDASSLPSGTFVVSPSFTVPSASATFDVATLAADGHLTFDGAALVAGAHCAAGANPTDPMARLTFTDATAPPTFTFEAELTAPPTTTVTADVPCSAAGGAFSLAIPAGIYRVGVYGVYSDASNLPGGSFTAVGRIDLH